MSTLVGTACAGADSDEINESDEVIGQQEAALFEDHFDLENGTRVDIALLEGKSAVMSVSGKTGTEAETRKLLSGATLTALYHNFRPDAAVPTAVLDFEKQLAPSALAVIFAEDARVAVVAAPSAVIPALAQDQAASGIAPQGSWFADRYCTNNIDIKKTFGTWYQAFDICRENRTAVNGTVSWTVSNLRQMFTALRMTTGTADFVMSRRANSTKAWTIVQNHTIAQGGYRWARLTQVNTTATNDMKFEIKNAKDDIFDWAVQTARTPMGSMPVGQYDGGVKYDSYHFICRCETSEGTYDIGNEYCLTNPLATSPSDDTKARNDAKTVCSGTCLRTAVGLGATLPPTHSFTAIARRSNGQMSCSPTSGNARICDRGGLPTTDTNGIAFLETANCTANGFFPSGWESSTLQ